MEEGFEAEKTEIDHVSAADIQGISPDKPIIFESPIMLKSGPIRPTTLYNAFGFVQTWTILYHDDFETRNSLVGWNVPTRAYCDMKKIVHGNSEEGDHFIQAIDCKGNTNILTKTFTTKIEHMHLKVAAELMLFGDWNGDSITVTVDGGIVWQKVFNGESHNDYEHPCPNLMALAVPVMFTCDHSAPTVTLSFTTTHSRHPCDGSFAIDDVLVYYK